MRLLELFDKPLKAGPITETRLDELFNSSQDVKMVQDEPDFKKASFEFNGVGFLIEMYRVEKNIWGIIYSVESGNHHTFKPTGDSGSSAPRILSTVANFIMKFLHNEQPEALRFSGSKGHGLFDLYTAMLRFLKDKIRQVGYHVEQGIDGNSSMFALVRNDFNTYADIEGKDAVEESKLNELFDAKSLGDWTTDHPRYKSYDFEVNGTKYFYKAKFFGTSTRNVWGVAYAYGDARDEPYKPGGDQPESLKVLSIVVELTVKLLKKYLLMK